MAAVGKEPTTAHNVVFANVLYNLQNRQTIELELPQNWGWYENQD
jgi:hypothetical protein